MKKQLGKTKERLSQLKKYEDVIIIFSSAILIIFALLLMVHVFEKLEIHVPGSREMWIGLIGALLGGVYTMLGVKMTLNYQSRCDNERDRLTNLPVLKFETGYSSLSEFNGDGIYSIDKNSIVTSAFPTDELKNYPTLTISLSNNNSAFDVHLDSFVTLKTVNNHINRNFFFPKEYRLVSNEQIQYLLYIIDYKEYNSCNVSAVIRISYADIFGNSYYQDIAVSYHEDIASPDMLLAIEHIRMPVQQEKALPLIEIMDKEYDYLRTDKPDKKPDD